MIDTLYRISNVKSVGDIKLSTPPLLHGGAYLQNGGQRLTLKYFKAFINDGWNQVRAMQQRLQRGDRTVELLEFLNTALERNNRKKIIYERVEKPIPAPLLEGLTFEQEQRLHAKLQEVLNVLEDKISFLILELEAELEVDEELDPGL